MATQVELLMTAARQVVDAEIAFSKARDDLTFARAQMRALSNITAERGIHRDAVEIADVLRAVAEVNDALERLSVASSNP